MLFLLCVWRLETSNWEHKLLIKTQFTTHQSNKSSELDNLNTIWPLFETFLKNNVGDLSFRFICDLLFNFRCIIGEKNTHKYWIDIHYDPTNPFWFLDTLVSCISAQNRNQLSVQHFHFYNLSLRKKALNSNPWIGHNIYLPWPLTLGELNPVSYNANPINPSTQVPLDHQHYDSTCCTSIHFTLSCLQHQSRQSHRCYHITEPLPKPCHSPNPLLHLHPVWHVTTSLL